MKNEPIAWVDEIWVTRPDLVRTQNLDIGRLFMRSAEGVKNYIPLYTHPAKTLTAQEVMEQTHKNISEAHWKKKTLTDEEIEQIGKEYGIKSVYQFAYYEFAKAILRKAQEK